MTHPYPALKAALVDALAGAFRAGAPRTLFALGRLRPAFEVAPDGKRLRTADSCSVSSGQTSGQAVKMKSATKILPASAALRPCPPRRGP